jgi:ribose transport system permease protein
MQTEPPNPLSPTEDISAGFQKGSGDLLKDLSDSSRSRTSLFERYAGLGFLVVLFGALSILLPGKFLTHSNVIAVIDTQVATAIVALGLLAPLAAGAFDISVSGVMTLAVVVSTALFADTHGSMPVALSILISLAVGMVAGVINGALVIGVGIDPFIVTLGSSSLFVALSELISHNQVVADSIPGSFVNLGNDTWLGIPLPVFYAAVLAVIVWYVLSCTPLGRMIYATGNGRETSRLSGIPTNRIIYGCLILAAETGSGQPNLGSSYLLPAYAAAFLGSTIIRPGRFNVVGLLIAIGILAFGVNGLQLDNAPTWVTDGFQGAALIIAVALSKIRSRTPK